MIFFQQVLTEISVKAGALVDSVLVRTSKGQEKKWGGNGGNFHETWRIPSGSSFLGFHGGWGGHIHCLGVTLAEQGGKAQGLSSTGTTSTFLSPIVKATLYSANPVTRACAQLLAFNVSSKQKAEQAVSEEVITALETMRKYADNLLASPLDPKVSRVRLGNGFFDRKIGRLPGGGGVIRAMGFELADEDGRMHYVFRRGEAGGGLPRLRIARQTLNDLVLLLKQSRA